MVPKNQCITRCWSSHLGRCLTTPWDVIVDHEVHILLDAILDLCNSKAAGLFTILANGASNICRRSNSCTPPPPPAGHLGHIPPRGQLPFHSTHWYRLLFRTVSCLSSVALRNKDASAIAAPTRGTPMHMKAAYNHSPQRSFADGGAAGHGVACSASRHWQDCA